MDKILKFDNVCFASYGNAVGKKEFEGPIGDKFDIHSETDNFECDTWEHAEGKFAKTAYNMALAKGKFDYDDVEILFNGDLINQCTPSYLGLLEFDTPKVGIYGACSTASLGIGLCGCMIEAGFLTRCAAVTSSHNLSAERQFRYPTEYGSLRSPTSQWTVTGAGAFILQSGKNDINLTEFCIGKAVDSGITDADNMGAAMAPGAFDTLWRYFEISGKKPCEFDRIITGDLGIQGYEILIEMFEKRGVSIASRLSDCGLIIYDRKLQKVNAGGSGCGCSAAVMSAYFLNEVKAGKLNDILFVGTGALLSPVSVAQGDSIAGISHLVRIEGKK